MNTNEIVGYLKTYDKRGEGEEIADDSILLELTEVNKDGSVELGFYDRNERCYVQFNLHELLRAVFVTGFTS